MNATVVDRLHNEFSSLIDMLEKSGEISLRSTADENLRKALLLSVASYFEHRMTGNVLSFVEKTTQKNPLVTALVRNKAVKRQYHTWFSWDKNNANSFFGLFGDEFRDFMKQKVKNNNELDNSIRAFLELGRERNRLVHQDFGSFSLEKTSEEIYTLYGSALHFINEFQDLLREFLIKQEVKREQSS